jgi:CRP-like cAMP-binding protein
MRVALLQGAALHEPDRPAEWVYFPLSGAVSLALAMKEKAPVEVACVGSEGAVGLFADFGTWQPSTRAVVLATGVAKAIRSDVFKTVVDQASGIRRCMLRYKETCLEQSQRIAVCNAVHPVEKRLARWLLQMSDRIGNRDIPLTQQTLAQLLGVRRTTVTLVARKFQRHGSIWYNRGHIEIVDRDVLASLACECYAASRREPVLVHHSDRGDAFGKIARDRREDERPVYQDHGS